MMTGECPSDEDLVRMIEGVVTEETLSAIETHVDGCEQCATVVAGLGALTSTGKRCAMPDHPKLVAVDPEHYILTEEIARGGMGRILRARDRRLGRQIAIKENLVNTGDHARRFEREARITARLQHPSIVHIHEAGVWPTGEPFFAMELVAGRSFDDVISRATTLDHRLALIPNVLAVADAIAYAHHQGIIHRDLKPKNVLVGDFGETVVIDWGLAKDMSGRGHESDDPFRTPALEGATEVGKVVGTPAYMPPEQARGHAIDQRTDVYALGAVLFHLLAGRPPITGRNTDEVLARIIAGPLPSLAEAQPDVPADLLAIVAKAMAFAPGDRYPSARELADDLRQFQTGQLVGAHRYSLGQLARRWLRRHRTAVAVAAAAAVVLVAISAVAIQRVVHAETVAQAERRTAEHDRADAEELMGFMLGDLRDKLRPLGKLDLLGMVASKATAYYDRRPIATDRDRRERAVALVNLGDVRLAQGQTAAALASYRTALAISEVLAAMAPNDEALQRDLEVKHNRIGEVLVAQGDSAGALAECRADIAISARLAVKDPTNAKWQRDLSISHEKLGDVLDAQGKFAEALVEFRQSLAITQTLAVQAPSPDVERDLGVGHERLGEVLARHDDLAAALTEHRAALAIREQLVANDPNNAILVRDLAASHDAIGALLVDQDDAANALPQFRAALALDERLVARDPSNDSVQSDLAACHDHLGKALRSQGDNAGALVDYRAAVAIQDQLAAKDPSDGDRQSELVLSHKGLGDVLRAQGKTIAALAEYQVTLDIAAKLAARDPHNAQWQHDLAVVHEKLGYMHQLQNDAPAALAEYRACLAVRERLAAADPTNTATQSDLAASHFNIGDVLSKADVAGALVEHRAALAITEALVAKDSSRAAWQHDLAESHQTIGHLLRAQGHATAALAELQVALALLEKLRSDDPTNQELQSDLAKLRLELKS
jgi:tetratricopeptide (TPR) repeat protein/tRNA A-37 threonylcarbamoyl transferase component Bud32